MAMDSVTSHYTRGTKPSDRVVEAGYNYRKVAENIASETSHGVSDPIRAVHLWWASPGTACNN
jgi:uncharacterized protein YkwD